MEYSIIPELRNMNFSDVLGSPWSWDLNDAFSCLPVLISERSYAIGFPSSRVEQKESFNKFNEEEQQEILGIAEAISEATRINKDGEVLKLDLSFKTTEKIVDNE